MLEPLDRRHLFEALRPPDSYDLDVAIGTTYSLDLMALLAVPLSFALFDWEDDSGMINADPLALLEAARRYSEKIHIFCQAGQIYLPKKPSQLLFELERIVKEVRPPNRRGIFHPKVWILRFKPSSKGDAIQYRVLCQSRNLTYDRSWDTLLRLDGELTERELAIAANHPLGEFVKSLPSLMIQSVDKALHKTIDRVQNELRRVRFVKPEGIEDINFHVLGLNEQKDWWFDGRSEKVLAVSPFVDKGFLKQLVSRTEGEFILVSRLEQLQELPTDLLAKCKKVFYLHPEASEDYSESIAGPESETEAGGSDTDSSAIQESLTGLHAKLYITDGGWNSSIWTGSANATNAAFSRNIEFLVELISKKSVVGVDAFLRRMKGKTCFADLLREYDPEEVVTEKDPDARTAEALAERIRSAIIDIELKASASVIMNSSEFRVSLVGVNKKSINIDQSCVTVRCWPINVPEQDAIDGFRLLLGEAVLFPRLSFEALTGFIAFAVKAIAGKRRHELRFVMNLPVEGMPTDRQERMLRLILNNKRQVLRMLLLLLADSGSDVLTGLAQVPWRADNDHETQKTSVFGDLSLFEALLGMLEHNPDQLSRVASLISDLGKTQDGMALLPSGFLDIWKPIWSVTQRVIHERHTK
jgi:hypothetical protein